MKHALVTPVASYLLIERHIGEKQLESGLFIDREQGVADFVVYGTVIAVADDVDVAEVGEKVIFHELAVEGGFRDNDSRDSNFLLVPAEKILGKYGG